MLNLAHQHDDVSIYQPRNPKASGYYRCVQDHFELLEMHWPERYAPRYGFWRPYVTDVIYRYLECGDLHFGFARVKCQECGHEYLLAYSCKRRHFCPSCHQKRVVEFGEWLCTQVLKLVPHRQWVFSIPKRLRIYFLFNRNLLAKLSQCAWKVLSAYLKQLAPFDDAVPGAAIAVHTFGDFQQFNPHLHLIATDGCFYAGGTFAKGSAAEAKDLEELFRYQVLKMLKAEGKINDAVIENMLSWRHSGFNVYCGPTIWPNNDQGLEDLARYIIRACFSQERMTYLSAKDALDGQAKVIYRSKDGRTSKTFDALDWLAQLATHIPNKGEQMVRYYGYYSNKSRGMRKKAGSDDQVPALVESAVSSTGFRRNWARLIHKIYQIDPLLCPKCQGPMKVISFIEDDALIKKVLMHLGLWETRNHDPPQLNDAPVPTIETELTYDYTYSQLPPIDYWT
jgi:ribosomal protein S27E